VLSTSVAGQLQETAEGSGGIEQYVGPVWGRSGWFGGAFSAGYASCIAGQLQGRC
jgi:hypothetical protein